MTVQFLFVCVRTAIIIREANKLWTGNEKIYFKSTDKKKLQLEELSTKLLETCAIPEIGFGYGTSNIHEKPCYCSCP